MTNSLCLFTKNTVTSMVPCPYTCFDSPGMCFCTEPAFFPAFRPFPLEPCLPDEDIYSGLSEEIEWVPCVCACVHDVHLLVFCFSVAPLLCSCMEDGGDDLYDCVEDECDEGGDIYEDLMRSEEPPEWVRVPSQTEEQEGKITPGSKQKMGKTCPWISSHVVWPCRTQAVIARIGDTALCDGKSTRGSL